MVAINPYTRLARNRTIARSSQVIKHQTAVAKENKRVSDLNNKIKSYAEANMTGVTGSSDYKSRYEKTPQDIKKYFETPKEFSSRPEVRKVDKVNKEIRQHNNVVSEWKYAEKLVYKGKSHLARNESKSIQEKVHAIKMGYDARQKYTQALKELKIKGIKPIFSRTGDLVGAHDKKLNISYAIDQSYNDPIMSKYQPKIENVKTKVKTHKENVLKLGDSVANKLDPKDRFRSRIDSGSKALWRDTKKGAKVFKKYTVGLTPEAVSYLTTEYDKKRTVVKNGKRYVETYKGDLIPEWEWEQLKEERAYKAFGEKATKFYSKVGVPSYNLGTVRDRSPTIKHLTPETIPDVIYVGQELYLFGRAYSSLTPKARKIIDTSITVGSGTSALTGEKHMEERVAQGSIAVLPQTGRIRS